MATKNKPSLKRLVFSKSTEIRKYLNVQSLLHYFIKPGLRFLNSKELSQICSDPSESQRAISLLLLLDKKRVTATRKFVACLQLENEHRGHIELSKSILCEVPPNEKRKLNELVRVHNSDKKSLRSTPEPTQRDCVAPEKPIAHIHLVGSLSMDPKCSFFKLDQKLWEYFSTADYQSLETLVQRMGSNTECPTDWKIVASWFKALITMHRDHQYSDCIEQVLRPALEQCTNSENCTILEGRILLHLAKMYLFVNNKKMAQTHFEMAREKLQFVGRGYEKANMFCRQAKLQSVTSTTKEERDQTEKLYDTALDCVPSDASYALASRPSLILSKVAFHLHLSFGKGAVGSPPQVSGKDVEKAKTTLQCLSQDHIILSIRKCEYSLVSAELLRIDGDFKGAAEAYKKTIKQSKKTKLDNITATAKCRLDYVHQELRNKPTVNTLLQGLP